MVPAVTRLRGVRGQGAERGDAGAQLTLFFSFSPRTMPWNGMTLARLIFPSQFNPSEKSLKACPELYFQISSSRSVLALVPYLFTYSF